MFFYIMKINIFWGELTDISANKEALCTVGLLWRHFAASCSSLPWESICMINVKHIYCLWSESKFNPQRHHLAESGAPSDFDFPVSIFGRSAETVIGILFSALYLSTADYHIKVKRGLCGKGYLVWALIYEATSLRRKLRWAAASNLTTCRNISSKQLTIDMERHSKINIFEPEANSKFGSSKPGWLF